MGEITGKENYLHGDVQAYRLTNGDAVWCLATVHPSSGRYSWSLLHPIIMAFLDDPQKTAAIMSPSLA